MLAVALIMGEPATVVVVVVVARVVVVMVCMVAVVAAERSSKGDKLCFLFTASHKN